MVTEMSEFWNKQIWRKFVFGMLAKSLAPISNSWKNFYKKFIFSNNVQIRLVIIAYLGNEENLVEREWLHMWLKFQRSETIKLIIFLF